MIGVFTRPVKATASSSEPDAACFHWHFRTQASLIDANDAVTALIMCRTDPGSFFPDQLRRLPKGRRD